MSPPGAVPPGGVPPGRPPIIVSPPAVPPVVSPPIGPVPLIVVVPPGRPPVVVPPPGPTVLILSRSISGSSSSFTFRSETSERFLMSSRSFVVRVVGSVRELITISGIAERGPVGGVYLYGGRSVGRRPVVVVVEVVSSGIIFRVAKGSFEVVFSTVDPKPPSTIPKAGPPIAVPTAPNSFE